MFFVFLITSTRDENGEKHKRLKNNKNMSCGILNRLKCTRGCFRILNTVHTFFLALIKDRYPMHNELPKKNPSLTKGKNDMKQVVRWTFFTLLGNFSLIFLHPFQTVSPSPPDLRNNIRKADETK